MQFWYVPAVPKCLNFATFSNDLSSLSKLCFCPTFWRRNTIIYLIFSVFTCRPTSLLSPDRDYVFFSMILPFLPSIITSSAKTRSWCVPFNSNPSSFSWTFLTTYSKAKLNSNDDKASPCFRLFWIRNATGFYVWPLHYRFRLNIF